MYVSNAKEPYKRDTYSAKRHIFSGILLIVATPQDNRVDSQKRPIFVRLFLTFEKRPTLKGFFSFFIRALDMEKKNRPTHVELFLAKTACAYDKRKRAHFSVSFSISTWALFLFHKHMEGKKSPTHVELFLAKF